MIAFLKSILLKKKIFNVQFQSCVWKQQKEDDIKELFRQSGVSSLLWMDVFIGRSRNNTYRGNSRDQSHRIFINTYSFWFAFVANDWQTTDPPSPLYIYLTPVVRATGLKHETCLRTHRGIRARICKQVRSPGINSKESITSQPAACSLADRYDNHIPTRFLAPHWLF